MPVPMKGEWHIAHPYLDDVVHKGFSLPSLARMFTFSKSYRLSCSGLFLCQGDDEDKCHFGFIFRGILLEKMSGLETDSSMDEGNAETAVRTK